MSLLPDAALTMEVAPQDVAGWLDLPAEERPRLIDCREEDELAICRLPGNEWIPLGLFPGSAGVLTSDTDRGIVVYCHHGMRSLQAVSFLRARGVEKAFSMAGGIDAWSRVIDPETPRY